ncbi:MAG: AAA family ATPase [Planctomycetota bacterium]
MTLPFKKPADRPRRLKLLLSGSAGVGKTTAAIQMPRPAVIDTEAGSVHYGDLIEKAGGGVFATTDATEIINVVRQLMSEPHDYLTLVVDPITTVYNMALDEAARKVGTEFGRHYNEANTLFKRLCNLLQSIDMNVVITAHEKDAFETQTNAKGETERVAAGQTFDGYKKLDYIFDLWLSLSRKEKRVAGSPRIATVEKTRLAEFPDRDRFEWSYDELVKRVGLDVLTGKATTHQLAAAEQVTRFKSLYGRLTADEVKALKIDKALKGYDDPADLPAEKIDKAIGFMQQHVDGNPAAA